MSELKPCPFCGAGETHIHENKGTWGGVKGYGEPISVEVRHWCESIHLLRAFAVQKEADHEAWRRSHHQAVREIQKACEHDWECHSVQYDTYEICRHCGAER